MKIITSIALIILFGVSCLNSSTEKKKQGPLCLACHRSNKECDCPLDLDASASGDKHSKSLSKPKQAKRLWAISYLWGKAPELQPEQWVSEKPETKGKYVLIEHWNTWCPPCRRSIKLLNELHRKFKEELVVIAITDEEPEAIKKMQKEYGIKLECYSAIDTGKRQKKELSVEGVPHVIVIEPEGFVVWEGFPYLKGYELTEAKIEKILAVGRELKEKKK